MSFIVARDHFLLAFATPIYRRRWPDVDDINNELRSLILSKEQVSAGVQRAQTGGWHSEDDLLDWGGSAIDQLKDRISDCIGEMIAVCTEGQAVHEPSIGMAIAWSNIIRNGNYHRLHTHPRSVISGVYFVANGVPEPTFDQEENGAIVFPDPRLGVEMVDTPGRPYGEKLRFHPEPGMMLAFPSWQPHMVNPFFGSGERISVSFNVTFNSEEEF